MNDQEIVLKNVKVHNLKGIDLTLQPDQLIVVTGVSGSGKSSLAFDTIYVEGQRRYIESLSTYARRYLGNLPKPEADHISGISPTIAIEQKVVGHNPRSSVGTITGIYDYLRILFARIGIPHCPISGEKVAPQSKEYILNAIQKFEEKSPLLILAPHVKGKKGEFKELFSDLMRKGFTRIRLDGNIADLSEDISVEKRTSHDIDLIVDRIILTKESSPRLTEAVTQALELGKGIMSVQNSKTKEETLFSELAYAPTSKQSYPPLEPQDFSFNHPQGMCETCEGLGTTYDFDVERIINPNLSIAEECCSIGGGYNTVKWGNIYDNLARLYRFSVHTPWKDLPESAKKVFLYGTEKKWTKMRFIHPEKGFRWTEYVCWQGVIHEAKRRLSLAKSKVYRDNMEALMHEMVCPGCGGARIKPYPAAAIFNGKRIHEITALNISNALSFFQNVKLSPFEEKIGHGLIEGIKTKLSFLTKVGLHYLSIDRTAPTLSGGESQRVRLASQIGSGLVGTTYILDEPSIGLHPRDNKKLLETLVDLKNRGNTVIVIEHDEEAMYFADHIVDVGPGAGSQGGEIVAKGTVKDLIASKRSLTGAYLGKRLTIPIPQERKSPSGMLTIEGATHHNLKNITVDIPLKVLVAVTGVSGSGKSSLITDILCPALANQLHHAQKKVGAHKGIRGTEEVNKVITIDQAPIGRTPRSNPSTYIKLFDDIRDLFASLPESQINGYTKGRFSFNVQEGSCPHCHGMGMIRVDMDFLEDMWTMCSACDGKRFDSKTLSIHYKGKNIYDILQMTVEEAFSFFAPIPQIKAKLELLIQVGLGYIALGQSSTTLSGGEAQRIKLAREMSRLATGKTLYILDEPTTGLHFHDIRKLIDILRHLVELGNTVIVIEHNMDLVKTADFIIDLGPEGGDGGGEVIGTGTPEEMSKKTTPTGIALSRAFIPKQIQELVFGQFQSFRNLMILSDPILTIWGHLRSSNFGALEPPKYQFLNLFGYIPKKVQKKRGKEVAFIEIKNCKQNNLKNLSLCIPRGKITVCTGPSGSGKTSLAFETLYAEGQRRYIESLSSYARQFVKRMPKPKVETIEGLSPSIAIEQKRHAGNPRSTVGTMTEIYDYLRLLYAHLGTPYCPETGEKIERITVQSVIDHVMLLPEKTPIHVLSPLALGRHQPLDEIKETLLQQGFLRIRLNGHLFELDETIPFDPKRKNELYLVIDRIIVKKGIEKRLFDAIEQAMKMSREPFVIATKEQDILFNLSFGVQATGKSYPPITPHTFSFNSEEGMCPDCSGLGFKWGANMLTHPKIMSLSPLKLMHNLWKEEWSEEAEELFLSFLADAGIDPDLPLYRLPVKQLQLFLNGSEDSTWIGINTVFANLGKAGKSIYKETVLPLLETSPCLSCNGERLNPLARAVKIDDMTIGAFCRLPLHQTLTFLQTLSTNQAHLLQEIINELINRFTFLCDVGLGYLSLDRSAPTLSGGETQRIHLARQLGSGLTGCLYMLDEPTIGLHPHNSDRLNHALKKLCSLGNTLLIVEHDPLTIQIADHVIDFGPGAGRHGGKIIAEGTLEQIKKHPHSLTGAYLSGKKQIPIPQKRRKASTFLSVENANKHNLQNLTLQIPIGVMTCLTGVSGSGKSTLMNDILKKEMQTYLATRSKDGICIKGLHHFNKLIAIDQNPIGRTIRADVSTFTDLFTPLRHFFASLPEAKMRGLQPKHFSYNNVKGMCRSCFGLGKKTINLQFLPSLKVTCEACKGNRLNPLSLQVTYKGKNLGQILNLTVHEAKEFLPPLPKIVSTLDTLTSVGLGYLTLGQEIASLSGGEAGRMRLSRELSKRSGSKTLYLFDEPTIGLHFEDIAKLLPIFHALVDKGNTVIIIEHNLDVIKNADHVIDLGPEAGEGGGRIVTEGTPEEVRDHPASYTAKYLRLTT